MSAVPTQYNLIIVTQDQAGQRQITRIPYGYLPDGTADTTVVGTVVTDIFQNGVATCVANTWQALTNAKIVRIGWQIDFDFAAEPTGETGDYEYVQSKASLNFEDGNGGKSRLMVPAPVNGLFLTGLGMQTVVDPSLAAGTGIIGKFVTSMHALTGLGPGIPTPRGGNWGTQFFGGQLVVGKPPRRRRIQSQ